MEPRFLCDEMLKGLGRWLRAAGYDTAICANGMSDADVLTHASREGRILITRDRHLYRHHNKQMHIVLLECDGLTSCARALMQAVPIDWLHKPFSRCMECNTPLEKAPLSRLADIPQQSRGMTDEVLHCPGCDKLYWEGSHVPKIRKRLETWQHLKRED